MVTLTIRVITNSADYDAVLQRIDEIFEAQPGTPEGYELELLLLMTNNYHQKHNPLPKVPPVEVLQFVMNQRGLKQADIAHYVGGKNRASEIMRGQRELTTQMIKKLSSALHIPVEALI